MTAIRMPDLRVRHEPRGARAVRLPDLRVPDTIRQVSRADGVAVSTALAAVGAALAWWLPGEGLLRSLGLALVVLGPLALLATLTLLPPAGLGPDMADDNRGDDNRADHALADIDERLPVLALQHSVRP